MKTFYNGYRFNETVNELIYNPTLALYFLESFQKNCKFRLNFSLFFLVFYATIMGLNRNTSNRERISMATIEIDKKEYAKLKASELVKEIEKLGKKLLKIDDEIEKKLEELEALKEEMGRKRFMRVDVPRVAKKRRKNSDS